MKKYIYNYKIKCNFSCIQKICNYILQHLTLRTSEAGIPALHKLPCSVARGIPALRKLPCGVGSQYTGGMACHSQSSHAGIPALFSTAYWHQNAGVIEIQTRQQLKNNLFHEIQQIFVNKFCIWTHSGQRTS